MDYYIDGQNLFSLKNHPYLGVMLSNDVRWNSHVENIVVVKANKSLRFVRHNLYHCCKNTKRSAYVTIVRPNLEYAVLLCGVHTDKNRLIQLLKQSSVVQPDLSKETTTKLLPLQKCYSN